MEFMTPLPFVWPYALVYWAVIVWAFWPEFRVVRQSQRSGNAADAGSLQVIFIGLQVAFMVAYPLAWVRSFQLAPAHRVGVFVTGVSIVIAGSLLRRHCLRMLGPSFTGDVRASANQEVITRGAYRVLRHPSYTAGILLGIGVGIALGSWASALLLAVVSFAVYSYRIAVEERALLAVIGEPYRRFMSTRKRLVPFVY